MLPFVLVTLLGVGEQRGGLTAGKTKYQGLTGVLFEYDTLEN